MNGYHRTFSSRLAIQGIVGLNEMQSLDDLIRTQCDIKSEENVPVTLITRILLKELSSKEVVSLIKNIHVNTADPALHKNLAVLLKNIPENLYFFLWSLRNSDVMPSEGILSSFQLKRSIYYLCKFLLLVELLIKREPHCLALYEKLGLVYLDLAGLAQYSKAGFLINGRLLHYTFLLRKAITNLQGAIKIEAIQGKETDYSHVNILNLVEHKIDFKKNRTNLYLNPWYFLYIASALKLLNDEEVAEAYLNKARLILNSLDEHQNPKVVAQKELLEAVYSTIKNGESVSFDFDEEKMVNIYKKIKRMRKYRNSMNGQRVYYSPLLENELLHQFQVHKALIKQGILKPNQIEYLRGIFTLYKQIKSPVQRDKLIFRLNIPPLKISGVPTSLKFLLANDPQSFLRISAPRQAVTN
ncbi:MAG: hypothetical protein ACE5HS_15570 [bacterium]